MTASIGPTQLSLPVGRREFLLDTPAQAAGAQLIVTNIGWPAGTIATIEVFYSYDGGLTFPDGVHCTATDQSVGAKGWPAGTLFVNASFKRTRAGVQVPTHCRAAIDTNNAVTTTVSAGWI